jgi:hypothetical protein
LAQGSVAYIQSNRKPQAIVEGNVNIMNANVITSSDMVSLRFFTILRLAAVTPMRLDSAVSFGLRVVNMSKELNVSIITAGIKLYKNISTEFQVIKLNPVL